MFSLTGLDGPTFRGSLEQLMQVERLGAARRGRALEEEGHDAAAGSAAPSHDGERYQVAATAYAQALHPQHERGPIYHAYQVMSRGVFTVRSDEVVHKAWRTLTDRAVGQAPVVDPVRGLVGLVSSIDLLRVLNLDPGAMRDVLSRSVADVMTSPIVSTDPVSDVRRVARVMLEFSLPAVPVVDHDGALVGIVTRGDILRTVVTEPPLTLWA
jgi:acetoin utilization protein AcuB